MPCLEEEENMRTHSSIVVIGEILYDIFPNYTRLGGAPFNFAYHLQKLGFPVCFISRIGRDDHGHRIMEELNRRGFDGSSIQWDERHPTGSVHVTLDTGGIPRFDIVADVAYDYIDLNGDALNEVMAGAGLIYFGTLIQRSRQGFHSLHDFLGRRPSHTLCFYDINLRPNCYTEQAVQASLKHADILKLNMEELQVCRQVHRSSQKDGDGVADLMERYSLKAVALTDGRNGSRLYTPKRVYQITPPEAVALADTVGAGDAFAAMLAAGMLTGRPPERMLAQASEFAAQICTIKGAIPETTGFYDPYQSRFAQGARDDS
jgi:fructokinase